MSPSLPRERRRRPRPGEPADTVGVPRHPAEAGPASTAVWSYILRRRSEARGHPPSQRMRPLKCGPKSYRPAPNALSAANRSDLHSNTAQACSGGLSQLLYGHTSSTFGGAEGHCRRVNIYTIANMQSAITVGFHRSRGQGARLLELSHHQ
jgi:hypothetical protein